ncbi:hypothetical protein C0J52_04440 [Blattella germanica]|nr:hypothetical protein C0J52_04440 [Blattella germanica]
MRIFIILSLICKHVFRVVFVLPKLCSIKGIWKGIFFHVKIKIHFPSSSILNIYIYLGSCSLFEKQYIINKLMIHPKGKVPTNFGSEARLLSHCMTEKKLRISELCNCIMKDYLIPMR